MDAGEAALFTMSVQQAVARGGHLEAALLELGWTEALQVSPATAVTALFAAQGSAAAASSGLHHVLAAGLGLEGTALVLLPPLERHDTAGLLDADRVKVAGVASASALAASDLLVPVGSGLVRVATKGLDSRRVQGLDPSYELVEVSGAAPAVSVEAAAPWGQAVALGHRALAIELVANGRAMLELARVHALDRVQFGRPISGFQAVRHRLADTLVALEAADGLIAASWEDESPVLAAMAKAVAGRAARTAARHCQQVLAGIGFTTEHRFHLHLRRTMLLDQLLGSARTLTRELGDDLLASRRLPALLPL